MQAFADALTAAGSLAHLPAHGVVSLLQEHLPSEKGWHMGLCQGSFDNLPDAEDIQGKGLDAPLSSHQTQGCGLPACLADVNAPRKALCWRTVLLACMHPITIWRRLAAESCSCTNPL